MQENLKVDKFHKKDTKKTNPFVCIFLSYMKRSMWTKARKKTLKSPVKDIHIYTVSLQLLSDTM